MHLKWKEKTLLSDAYYHRWSRKASVAAGNYLNLKMKMHAVRFYEIVLFFSRGPPWLVSSPFLHVSKHLGTPCD